MNNAPAAESSTEATPSDTVPERSDADRSDEPKAPAKVGRFAVVWLIPLGLLVTALALYVIGENRIYFYDTRGFQEMAMAVSSALHSGPRALWNWMVFVADKEYPSYWALPFSVFPPETINIRLFYIMGLALLGLVPVVVFLSKIVARLLNVRVTIWIVLIVAFNPALFLTAVQGVPDLIGLALILAAGWILLSRPMGRSALFWALIIGSMSLLVKKNFLFDVAILFVAYLIAIIVSGIVSKDLATRMRALLREVLSVRVILAFVGVVGAVTVLTPGTLSAIFDRNNSLFYESYQSPLSDVFSDDFTYAGGWAAWIAAGLAVTALVLLIRRGGAGRQKALFIAGYLALAEFFWAITQRQAGLIHEIHVWPLVWSLGLVSIGYIFGRPSSWRFQSFTALGALVICLFMFLPSLPGLDQVRIASREALPAVLHPTVSPPLRLGNMAQLESAAETIRTASETGGPILVPIGSRAMNSSILTEIFAQRLSTAAPDIYLLPQIDLQDALPWSSLVGDDGRTVLVSTTWTPDLAEGRENLMSFNEFLQSPAAKKWVVSSAPLDLGTSPQMSDLTLMEVRIPQSDAMEFAAAIRQYLPTTTNHGLEDQFALLSDQDRRTQGPSSANLSTWPTIVGSTDKSSKILVNPETVSSVGLAAPGEACDSLQYTWTDVASSPAREISHGALAGKRSIAVPAVPSGDRSWSLVLSLGQSTTKSADCLATLSAKN